MQCSWTMNDFFDPSTRKITRLLDTHLAEAERKYSSQKIKWVLVYGEFAECAYVNRVLHQWVAGQHNVRLIVSSMP
jgi:hypothetical protein